MGASVFKKIEFDSVEEIIEFLNPNNDVWNGMQFQWGFRGQAISNWGLTPSLLRNKRYLNFLAEGQRDTYLSCGRNDMCVLAGEYNLIHEFIEQADRIGLKIPEHPNFVDRNDYFNALSKLEPNNLHAVEEEDRDEIHQNLPPVKYWPSFAVAQHHGAPTRFLDWSWNPYTALYFAAIGSAHNFNPDESISVWCVHTTKIQDIQENLRIVTVPRSENAYLHAQHGFFTIDITSFDSSYCLASKLEQDLEVPDKWLIDLISGRLISLYQLNLGHIHAGKLLRLLYNLDHSAQRYFPGYEGIVKGFQEIQY